MNKRKGLTLLEIVISMALVGIVTVVFLTIFISGNKNIFRAGIKTEDIYSIQEEVDILIGKLNINKDYKLEDEKDEENEVEMEIKEEPNELKIEISEILEETIYGKFITGAKDGLEIITFVPDNPQSKDD